MHLLVKLALLVDYIIKDSLVRLVTLDLLWVGKTCFDNFT